jgi:hypothetical protein
MRHVSPEVVTIGPEKMEAVQRGRHLRSNTSEGASWDCVRITGGS